MPNEIGGKIEDILTRKPIIITVNEFNEASYTKFCNDFDLALNSAQPFIPINIDSFGGEIYSLLGMVNLIKNSSKPIYTFISTKGMSCGSVLFTCGVKRFIAPYSTLLIHDAGTATWVK